MVQYLLSADVPLHVVVLQQIPKFLLRFLHTNASNLEKITK